MSIKIQIADHWANSHYVFEMNPSDGTKYTVQVCPAEYGGIYAIVNESSLWRWHGDNDVKFLCGNNNKYTKKAVIKIMTYHDQRMIDMANEANI